MATIKNFFVPISSASILVLAVAVAVAAALVPDPGSGTQVEIGKVVENLGTVAVEGII